MEFNPDNPLIAQSDRTLLLEVQHPLFEEARNSISPFTELIKSPEYVHTYRITPLSLWNAAAAGMSAGQICAILERYAKYGIPSLLISHIQDYTERYGLLRIEQYGDQLFLTSEDPLLLE